MLLLLTVPLIRTDSMTQACHYVKALFGGTGVYAWSGLAQYYLNAYWPLLLVSIAGSLRLFAWLKQRIYPKNSRKLQLAWQTAEAFILMMLVILSIGVLFKTGTITFMYQQ